MGRTILTVGLIALSSTASPTFAGVYQASAIVSGQTKGFGSIDTISLPKYSGTAQITGVNISLSGSASGDTFFNYFEVNGITIAPFSEQWDIGLVGPGLGPGIQQALIVPAIVDFPGVSIPPGPYDNPSEVDIKTAGAPFSGNVDVTDFSDYAGNGSNDFFVFFEAPDGSATAQVQGTVTEAIFTAPEPSTWAMLLLGFAGLGFVGHRASRAATGGV